MSETNKIQGQLQLYDTSTYVDKDVSDNLVLSDTNTGTKTLEELATTGALANDITSGVGWNASTNSPTITSGVGNQGDFAVVSVTGTTTIDSISLWTEGDYIWYDASSSVWRKISNATGSSEANRVEFVVTTEAEFENAYTEINNYYEGGIIRLGDEITLTKNHSFSHENIVIECDYNHLWMGGYDITIVGSSCYYNNGFFDAEDLGSQFKFSLSASVSTNYLFYNCRFHQFIDTGTAVVWDMSGISSASAHLFLKDSWVSGSSTIDSYIALIQVSSSSAYADVTITGFRSEQVSTQSRTLGTIGSKPGAGLSIIYDGSCVLSNTLTPDRIFNILNRWNVETPDRSIYVGFGTDGSSTNFEIFSSSTYLDVDGSNNLTFTDAVTGTKTLAELAATVTPVSTVSTIGGVLSGTDIDVDGSGNVTAAASLVPVRAIDLGASKDLDTYVTPGFYYQNSNADAASGSNYPTAQAGSFVVQQSAGVTQQYYRYNSSDTEAQLYLRSFYNSVWTPWRKVYHEGNTGSGSGLDADTVDTLQASQFLRSDADDTGTGAYVLYNVYAGTSVLTSGSGAVLQVNGFQRTGNIYLHTGGNTPSSTGSDYLSNSSGSVQWNGNTIWHAGNDAPLMKTNADDTFTGRLSVGSTSTRRAGMYGTYDSTKVGHIWSMGTAYVIDQDGSTFGNLYGFGYYHTNNGSEGTMAAGHQAVWCTNGVPQASFGDNGVWTSYRYYIVDSNTWLGEGTGNSLQLGTNSGYINIGPQNTSWCHFDTDRAAVYFYEEITAPDFNLTSDIYFKKNIKPYDKGLEKVLNIEPVYFDWDETKPREGKARSGHDLGVIAQQLEEVEPLLVKKEKDGFKGVKYNKITILNTAAIQELNSKLEAENLRLHLLVKSLREEVEDIKKHLQI